MIGIFILMITAFLVIADGATQSHPANEITGLNLNEIQGSLTVKGNVNVGGSSNTHLRVRHLDGKLPNDPGVDDLFLQHGTQKNVFIGGTQRSDLFVIGNVVIGHGTNGILTVRHINGKSGSPNNNNDPDHLYLNWENNKDVYIGGEKNSNLIVKGNVQIANSDLYFTKTDHTHTGTGNTAGYAAIENTASPYNALMILGRATDADPNTAGVQLRRVVKLWDYLQVNGNLDVTGNIKAPSIEIESRWKLGSDPHADDWLRLYNVNGNNAYRGGFAANMLWAGAQIYVGNICFKPRALIRCYIGGDHMTWVDNAGECTGAGYSVEGTIKILAEAPC